MLKHKVVSTLAQIGVSVGMPSKQEDLRDLLQLLHPVNGGYPAIRVGAADDGGYVMPDDLDGIRACFSPGVDNRATFEMALVERGIPCFLADASVAKAPVEHPMLEFERKFVGVVNEDPFMRMDDWVAAKAPAEGDLLLQMDIEGWEWPVLLNMSDDTLKRFRIIVIEMHFMDRLLDREGFTTMSSALRRLMQHFVVVHNHPNNYGGLVKRGDIEIPRALEVSLLRRDRVKDWTPVTSFPHPLDQINNPNAKDIVLPAAWHA
jgi:hypothetical protein